MAKKNKRSRIWGRTQNLEVQEQKCRTALVLLFAGQSAEAIKVLRGLTARSPKYAKARFMLVDIYLARKRSDQALKELQAIIRYHPESFRGRKQLADLLPLFRPYKPVNIYVPAVHYQLFKVSCDG